MSQVFEDTNLENRILEFAHDIKKYNLFRYLGLIVGLSGTGIGYYIIYLAEVNLSAFFKIGMNLFIIMMALIFIGYGMIIYWRIRYRQVVERIVNKSFRDMTPNELNAIRKKIKHVIKEKYSMK